MKIKGKVSALLVGAMLLTSGIASAHAGHGADREKHLSVLVNGVKVMSSANHMAPDNKIYVSVEAFAGLFDKSFELIADKKSILFNGKAISGIRMANAEPTAWIEDLAAAVDAQKVNWDVENQEAYVLALPKGTIQLDPHPVPAMGEHWANPQELPLGPIYGVHNGKLIFLEYMIGQEDFKTGKSHVNIGGMKGVPSPSVVQTDVEFQPQGHPGFDIPHYDMHAYFISDEEQHKIATVFTELKNAKGEKIGYAAFMQMGPQLLLRVKASGLTPGEHGFHIHEKGIEGNDLKSAGGHFNPTGKKHGHNNPDGAHLGDLMNIVADKEGNVDAIIPLQGVSLEAGSANSVLGRSLIIHASADDGKTDPSGNSGDRVAGGNLPK